MTTIVYAGHREHAVRLIDQGTVAFPCMECGKKGDGPRYSCDACSNYCLHVGCASLPPTRYSSAHPEHGHTVERMERPPRNCDIQGHKMGGNWNYFSSACPPPSPQPPPCQPQVCPPPPPPPFPPVWCPPPPAYPTVWFPPPPPCPPVWCPPPPRGPFFKGPCMW